MIASKDAEERIRKILEQTRAEAINAKLGGSQQEYGLEHALLHIIRIAQSTNWDD